MKKYKQLNHEERVQCLQTAENIFDITKGAMDFSINYKDLKNVHRNEHYLRICGKTNVFLANYGERFQNTLRAIPHLDCFSHT